MADIKTSVERAVASTDGALGATLVDFESGLCLAMAGSPTFDLELAAAGSAEIVRAKKRIRDKLGIEDRIEDILITLENQYHLIRMVGTSTFLYMALDRSRANLAMARRELADIERNLEIERV